MKGEGVERVPGQHKRVERGPAQEKDAEGDDEAPGAAHGGNLVGEPIAEALVPAEQAVELGSCRGMVSKRRGGNVVCFLHRRAFSSARQSSANPRRMS